MPTQTRRIGTPRVFALNVHANYRCRHSGACCTAGWAIPVEPARRHRLGADVLVPQADGACQFYDREGRLCRVHRDQGEAWLPSSCHHFPRRVLVDDRGVFVSLSHFCPTAARLLVEATEPLEVVESPPGFPADREYEGLDGRGAWPPLVKRDRLFDLESFDAWERFALAALTDEESRVSSALRRLAAAAEHVRNWSAEEGPLLERVRHLATRRWTNEELETAWTRYEPFATLHAYESLLSFVPDGLTAPQLTTGHRDRWRQLATAVTVPEHLARRYVAARMFGSWAAYEAFGLRTMVAELVVADLVLRVEAVRGETSDPPEASAASLLSAVRAADWLLVHAVDRPALVTWLGAVEHDGHADRHTARPTKNGPRRSR